MEEVRHWNGMETRGWEGEWGGVGVVGGGGGVGWRGWEGQEVHQPKRNTTMLNTQMSYGIVCLAIDILIQTRQQIADT